MSKKTLLRLVRVGGPTLLFILCYIILSLWASVQEQAVDQAWMAMRIDPRTLPSRFPTTQSNTTAHMLSDMIKRLPRPLPLHEEFVRGILDTPTDDIPPLPEDLRRYLQVHATQLMALYAQVQRESPQWDFDLEKAAKYTDAPVPDFLEHRNWTLVFASDILEKTRQGEPHEALAAFSAAWTINAALRQRPEVMSQRIAMHMDTLLAKVLRKMHDVPPAWQSRLLEHDYHKSQQLAFAVEAWRFATLMRGDVFAQSEKFKRGVMERLSEWSVAVLGKPYFRLCGVNSAEALRQGVQALQQQDVCSLKRDTPYEVASRALAGWNIIDLGAPDVLKSWAVASKTMLTLEGTQKILYVKERLHVTPESRRLPETAPLSSVVCPGASWEYHATSDGTFTLTFLVKTSCGGNRKTNVHNSS